MGRDIECDQIDPVARAIDRALGPEFLLEIASLLIGQASRNLVEPVVDRALVHVEDRLAFLVEQRRHGAVRHGVLHRVGMNDASELVGRLVVLEERCARERDIGGIRQRFAHPLVVLAALAAVAFVNQHDHVCAVIPAFRVARCAAELVDDREDDPFGALADALGQIVARLRLGLARIFRAYVRTECAAGQEVACQLFFQIAAVGHDDQTAGLQLLMQQQRLPQHHHREALARSRGVPNYPAFARAIGFDPTDLVEQRADTKELLMARDDLVHLAVEQDVGADEFQQALGRA